MSANALSSTAVSFASVAVARRHAGLGLYLIVALERAAKLQGADSLTTTVEKTNPKLLELYRRIGWEVAGQNEKSVSLCKQLVTKETLPGVTGGPPAESDEPVN
jgi:hypothetical protein